MVEKKDTKKDTKKYAKKDTKMKTIVKMERGPNLKNTQLTLEITQPGVLERFILEIIDTNSLKIEQS